MKTRLLTALLAVFASFTILAAGPAKITDINEALAKAKAENKMLFLQYGREACSNCQALRAIVASHKLQLSPSKFVYADVNCDDSETSKVFRQKFKVSGSTLPFVVVVAPDGTQLAGRTGYGDVPEFTKLIHDAQKSLKK
jgi:thioredoxin-related protein